MHVVFISESRKKAIAKVNTILDSYAMRIGRQTWATPITDEALKDVHVALRSIATRHTAVACYRNDARHGMKLTWIVGSKKAFSQDGAVPVHTVQQASLRQEQTASWLRYVCLLAQAAGLIHDFGKYSEHFQAKLRSQKMDRDAIRHEWLSVCILRALSVEESHKMTDEHSWEKRWHNAWVRDDLTTQDIFPRIPNRKRSNGAPTNALEAIEFLVASHHRLFAGRTDEYPYLEPSHVREKFIPIQYRTPFFAPPEHIWKRFRTLLHKLDAFMPSALDDDHKHNASCWAAMMLARTALIFADHTVSALHDKRLWNAKGAENAAANTHQCALNQPLEWHLEQVAHVAGQTAWRMGQLFLQEKPEQELDGIQEASLAAILEPAHEKSRFHWQNVVIAALDAWRKEYPTSPCLLLSMAGTGSGKTRMNIRAACVLSRSTTPRCSIALNLRSLTLQTGEALKNDLGILSTDIATVIGDTATQKLFCWKNSTENSIDCDENTAEAEIYCHSDIPSAPASLPAWLEAFFTNSQQRMVISTPLLVSTIDFLDAAGNPHKQGHHVKAFLRLLTSDLVLDEIDSYEPEALVSVLRLVQLCAFFQRNVLCSSATLSQSVATAIHDAWKSGVHLRQSLLQTEQGTPITYAVALVDDVLPPTVHTYSTAQEDFATQYARHVRDLCAHIRKAEVYRYAFLQKVDTIGSNVSSRDGFFMATLEAVKTLHEANAWDFSSEKHISFGLVRMANIQGAVHMARFLATTIPHAYVACYHANDWRIQRFHKERRLDFLLTRKHGNQHILDDDEIRRLVTQCPERHVCFIVVATPVEEVGRDHDFDWAVIEPSSAQSIVQTAGRVNRHRLLALDGKANLAILQYNLKHCKNIDAGKPQKAAFERPGYEEGKRSKLYLGHDLQRLLPWDDKEECAQGLGIDAALRLDDGDGGSKLAQADDAGITRRVTKYFGSALDDDGDAIEGFFTQQPIHAYRMTEKIYKDTRLRDFQRKDAWRMRVARDTELATFERLDSDGLHEQWVENNTLHAMPAMPNAWLCLSPIKMLCLCDETGVCAEEGLFVELMSYDDYACFEYDAGFGICRSDKDL